MIRHITSARRADRSTLIKLDCGHERSLGGHRFFNGFYIPDPRAIVGREYDCQDGQCYRAGGKRA